MKTFAYDLRYIQAGLEGIENYLLSDEIFWPLIQASLVGEPEYPRLTLGGLLLARQRLSAYPMTHLQEAQLQEIIAEMDRIRSKWRVAWENKAGHEFCVRLRMWRDYIEEYRANPMDNADRYSYEVRLRVMLSLLKSEGGEHEQGELDLLSGLDGYLNKTLQKGSFIWETQLQGGFQTKVYWYLYGTLPTQLRQ